MARAEYLWDAVALPMGVLSVLVGREGLGKSTLWVEAAARLTRGELPGCRYGVPCDVVVYATEDSAEHTLKPRLLAAGVDPQRLHLIPAADALELPDDASPLRAALDTVSAALVVIDPLMSTMGSSTDTHKDADVRKAVEPLVALAHEYGATVLAVMHQNKDTNADIGNSIGGSRAFGAIPRHVFAVLRDPDDESARLVGVAKNNLGRDDLPALRFRIVEHDVTEDGITSTVGAVEWLDSAGVTIREAHRLGRDTDSDRAPSQTESAGEWVVEYLRENGGRAPTRTVEDAAKVAGFGVSSRTLLRAAKRCGVRPIKVGSAWHWSLPTTEGSRRPHIAELDDAEDEDAAESLATSWGDCPDDFLTSSQVSTAADAATTGQDVKASRRQTPGNVTSAVTSPEPGPYSVSCYTCGSKNHHTFCPDRGAA